jgi:5-methylcytosine-specific restriction endonuclease McrA
MGKVLKLHNSTYYKYVTHLQSDYWRNIRRKALERDNEICQECMQAKATEVHHLTYRNMGNEPLEDLVSLCSRCHRSIHKVVA